MSLLFNSFRLPVYFSGNDEERVAGVDRCALADRNGGNRSVAGGHNLVFHFHRFDDAEHVAALDGSALLGQNLEDGTRQRRGDLLPIAGGCGSGSRRGGRSSGGSGLGRLLSRFRSLGVVGVGVRVLDDDLVACSVYGDNILFSHNVTTPLFLNFGDGNDVERAFLLTSGRGNRSRRDGNHRFFVQRA